MILYAPERFEKACLLNDRPTEAIKHIKHHFSRENVRNGNIRKCIILSGAPGTGKTHSLYALMNAARPEKDILKRIYGKNCYGNYCQCDVGIITPSFFSELQYAPFGDKEYMLKQTRDISILCIDDMGMETNNEKNAELLEAIIDYRYSNILTTVITTNLPLDAFKMRYSDRILDRLREWGTFIELTGTSLRENPDQEFNRGEETDWEKIVAEIKEENRQKQLQQQREAEAEKLLQEKLHKISERIALMNPEARKELEEKNRKYQCRDFAASFRPSEAYFRSTLAKFALENNIFPEVA